MPQNFVPPPAASDDGLTDPVADVVIPSDSDTVTEPLPARVRLHGDSLEAVGAGVTADDPIRPTQEFVDALSRSAHDVFLGPKGDRLVTFLSYTGELTLWRAGIDPETAADLSSPHNADYLDDAGVAVLQTSQRYARARNLLDMERVAELPKRLGTLRFRRRLLKTVDNLREALARGVTEEEVAIDEIVRPAYERLKPLSFIKPLWLSLEPLRQLVEVPIEKGQATRRTWEKGYEEGVAQGRAEAESEARQKAQPQAGNPAVVFFKPGDAAAPAATPAPGVTPAPATDPAKRRSPR